MNFEWSEYAEHRTADEVRALLRYGNISAMSRGLTRDYVAKHFPGWTWNSLMAIWDAAGIFIRPPGGGRIFDEQVKSIHFNGPSSLAVEWIDGSVTVRKPHLRGHVPPG